MPILLALKHKRIEMLKKLLEFEDYLLKRNEVTIFIICFLKFSYFFLKSVTFRVQEISPLFIHPNFKTAFEFACQYGSDLETLECFFSHPDFMTIIDTNIPLTCAAKHKREDVCRALLIKGASKIVFYVFILFLSSN